MGQPRPLRALQRPWLDAAVRAAAFDRLQPADGSAEALPPVALPDRRSPGSQRNAGRGNHHGPARSGSGQCRGFRAGGKGAGGTFQPSGSRRGRPSYLRFPRRRLPDGGHLPRSRLARRHLGPGQAGGDLRRQRHLDRRRGARLVHRRHSGALRGLRLERDPPCRRPRRRGDQGGHRAGQRAVRQAHADLLQDHHRLWRAAQAGQGREPRRAAGQGRDRWGARRAGLASCPLRDSRRDLRRLGSQGQGCRHRAGLERRFRGVCRGAPGLGGRVPAALQRRAAGRLGREIAGIHRQAAGGRPGRGFAQGLADDAGRVRPAAARADRRFWPVPTSPSGRAASMPATATAPAARATTSTTACASSA